MAYTAWSVVAGEQPSATKWNLLGSNDASFNDSSGLVLNGADGASVLTSETTTSTSYTDLATAGPAVTVTIGASGKALVIINAQHNTSSGASLITFAASGGNTIAASDDRSGVVTSANNFQGPFIYLAESLTAGSTTFTMKYRVTGGTGTFLRRYISVIPL